MSGSSEVAIVGVTFEGRQQILAELYAAQESGLSLGGELVREPDNPYDANAVAAQINGRPVGYVPKGLAAKFAARRDAGEIILVNGVRVTQTEKRGEIVYGARFDVELEGHTDKEEVGRIG